jgi:hypothetical protein
VRAYRWAAETIRGAALPVADLVRVARARQLRGVGPGIEARLRELVETGDIAELAELDRELAPGLVALARYLGLGTRRSVRRSPAALASGTPRSGRRAVAEPSSSCAGARISLAPETRPERCARRTRLSPHAVRASRDSPDSRRRKQ